MSMLRGNLTGVSILIDRSPVCSNRLNWKVRTGGISLMLSCLTASCVGQEGEVSAREAEGLGSMKDAPETQHRTKHRRSPDQASPGS